MNLDNDKCQVQVRDMNMISSSLPEGKHRDARYLLDMAVA